MCGGGGGGGSGTQKYEWNETMKPYWENVISRGANESGNPYRTYNSDTGRSKIAPLSGTQNQAGAYLTALNSHTGDPTKSLNAAQNQTQATLGNSYLSGAGANPHLRENEFQGTDNPYFRSVLGQGLGDITNSYKDGTSADTTRMFNLSGAFGGSAHQKAIANNEAGLGKTLNNYAQGMYNDQYNRSAGLDEARLDRGSGSWNAERGRQMQAIGAGQNENDMALRRAGGLMSYGDLQRSLDQGFRDEDFANWFGGINHGKNNLSWLSGLLGAAQGGMAPMQQNPGASTGSQLLGGGLLLSSLFGS